MVSLKEELKHKCDVYERAIQHNLAWMKNSDEITKAYYEGKNEVYKIVIGDIDKILLRHFKTTPADLGLKGSKTKKPSVRKPTRK